MKRDYKAERDELCRQLVQLVPQRDLLTAQIQALKEKLEAIDRAEINALLRRDGEPR
jgi:hypothetical protein